MLRLFHKIRRQLFSENKVGRYLLYALGEIILIVIGILIAITIDNNNEERKIRKMEQAYLVGLKSEFEQSRRKLQTLIEVNRDSYADARKIANYISSGTFPEEKELSVLLFNAVSFEIAYNPNNSLLNEVISTGYLKNIRSQELRQELAAWESVIQGIHRQEATMREQREKILDLFRNDQGSIRTILDQSGISEQQMGMPASGKAVSNLPVIKSRTFENNLLPYVLTGMNTEQNHYIPLLERINRILQLIDEEIVNRP